MTALHIDAEGMLDLSRNLAVVSDSVADIDTPPSLPDLGGLTHDFLAVVERLVESLDGLAGGAAAAGEAIRIAESEYTMADETTATAIEAARGEVHDHGN